MTGFGYFGGIDFSGAKEPLSNLWSAVGVAREGRLHVLALQPHPFRADLASYVAGGWRRQLEVGEGERILWGADFPFALPAAAARILGGARAPSWAAVAAWVADRPADEIRDTFPELGKTMRACDPPGAMAPFDMRIYKQTAAGIRWLHELREEAGVSILPQAPVDGAATTVVEVYPSATHRDLGFKFGKSVAKPAEARARGAALRTFATFAHPSLELVACGLEDAWDAVLACLTACRASTDLDQPFGPGRPPREAVALEGWIYRVPEAVKV
jgi:hypothetical protein